MILNDEKIIKELNLNGYKEIENHLNTMLKGGKKIWDLYKEYLEENPY